jgi:hypothetical protein
LYPPLSVNIKGVEENVTDIDPRHRSWMLASGIWATFASLQDSGGASLEMIDRLLVHTQIGTT